MPCTTHPDTLPTALHGELPHPARMQPEAWNWKAAGTSAFLRGSTLLAANMHDGPVNALRAVVVEVVFALFRD